jgi:hypothetical protein
MRKLRPQTEASRRHGRTPTLGTLPEDKRWQIVDEYFHDTGLKFKGLPLKGSMTRIGMFHGIDFKTVRKWVRSAAETPFAQVVQHSSARRRLLTSSRRGLIRTMLT